MSASEIRVVVSWWANVHPVLPSSDAMQWGLQLGWSVVLAWLGVLLAARWMPQRAVQAGVAVALAASAYLPGQLSTSYWLGLAFQAPSTSAVVLGLAWLAMQWHRWRADSTPAPAMAMSQVGSPVGCRAPDTVLAVIGIALGWALLLDTLALMPVSLYAWGFSPAAPVVVLLLGLLPWVLWGGARRGGLGAVVCAVVVLVFVWMRLPRGNLWDAVLDPWLWLGLHIVVGHRSWNCYKNKS